MKLIVKELFRDKFDHVTEYAPGTIIDVQDDARAHDLVARGLCAAYGGKKKATVVLESVETPEAQEEAQEEPIEVSEAEQ